MPLGEVGDFEFNCIYYVLGFSLYGFGLKQPGKNQVGVIFYICKFNYKLGLV